MFDLSSLSGVVASLWQLALGALRLNPEAFVAAVQQQGGTALALIILLLGGISMGVGQSVVLFANRVPPLRFIISLFAGAVVLGVVVLFWTTSIWVLGNLVFEADTVFLDLLTVVSLSYAPYLFGFLVLMPYLGNILSRVLNLWVFLAVIVGVAVTYQFGFWESLATALLGWVLLELVTRIPWLRIRRLDNWLWQVTTGKTQRLDAQTWPIG
jgi:hypothetical protein